MAEMTGIDGGLRKTETLEYAAAQRIRLKLEALSEAVMEAEEMHLDVKVVRPCRGRPFEVAITQRL